MWVLVKSGWGDWAGPGAGGTSQKTLAKRKRILQHAEEHAAELRAGRRDAALANVVISDRRIKTSAKFKIAEVPHPFTSREEYERSLQMPLGGMRVLVFFSIVTFACRGVECKQRCAQEY